MDRRWGIRSPAQGGPRRSTCLSPGRLSTSGQEERTFVITSASRRRKEPKSSPENTGIARRRQPDRERKSSGSETTFSEDLIDPVQIETAVIAMADDVWAWCEKTNCRGRTVTVKIKWANFQTSSRSRSIERPIDTRDKLHELALELIRTVFPPQKAIRLVGVTLSNFRLPNMGADAELPFREI